MMIQQRHLIAMCAVLSLPVSLTAQEAELPVDPYVISNENAGATPLTQDNTFAA